MYTLRFPFRLPAGQSIEVGDALLQIGQLRWTLAHSHDWYALKIEGFESEAGARAYVTTVWATLIWVQLNAALAIDARLDINRVQYAHDPVAAATNLSAAFGFVSETPIEGLVDGSAPSVYPTDKKVLALTGGDAQVTIVTPMERVVQLLQEGLGFPAHDRLLTDAKLCVAIDLYGAHFSETSINARFLTLVMALEALAEGEKRPAAVLDLLASWRNELDELKHGFPAGDERRTALESIERELFFRQENSIRSQVRTLVKATLTAIGDADAEQTARSAVKIYDHRSTLVHEGRLERQVLSQAFSDVKSIVERVLRARVRILLTASAAF